MPADIVGGRVSTAAIARVAVEHVERLSQHQLRFSDIVFSRRGDVTRFARVAEREVGWLCGTGCLKVRIGTGTIALPEWIAIALGAPEVKDWLVRHAVGATMPNLNTSILGAVPLRVPPIEQQREAVEVCFALDDRIDLLRQTNATLESITQALFKSWFIDFDPVRAKAEGREPEGMDAATAALFPAEFEESALGLIPKGWKPGKFGDIAVLAKGSMNPLAAPDEKFEHYSLPAFDAEQLPIVERGEAIKSNKTRVPAGAVLQSKLNPHIPRVWLPSRIDERAICSTEFLPWVAKASASREFIYSLLRGTSFETSVRALVTGTSNSHQRVKPDQVAKLELVLAPSAIAEAFTQVARPLLSKVGENRLFARSLAELRDTLLPRLISGKLRLPEAQALTQAAP
jgi:type I restriction enzyme S subunit